MEEEGDRPSSSSASQEISSGHGRKEWIKEKREAAGGVGEYQEITDGEES